MAKVRVLVVAEDPLAGSWLAAMLGAQPGIEVVGQDAAAGIERAAALHQPDVIVLDPGLQPETSLGDLSETPESFPPVLVLVATPDLGVAAWASGAKGLLLRNVGAEALAAAVSAVAQATLVLDPAIASRLIPGRTPVRPSTTHDLTPRELEVLQLMAEGMANKAIAARLGVSEHTVKFHVNALLGKLAVGSRTEAVVQAARLGLVFL